MIGIQVMLFAAAGCRYQARVLQVLPTGRHHIFLSLLWFISYIVDVSHAIARGGVGARREQAGSARAAAILPAPEGEREEPQA